MTREDIIKLAREVGLHIATDVNWMPIIGLEYAERFAALVAAAERESIKQKNAPVIERINAHIKALEDAVTDEREACAKVCDELAARDKLSNYYAVAAKAIRARGNT